VSFERRGEQLELKWINTVPGKIIAGRGVFGALPRATPFRLLFLQITRES